MLSKILLSALLLVTAVPLFAAQPPDTNSSQKVEREQPSQKVERDQKEPRYFHLDFVVRELDGKRATISRNYSMIVIANDRAHGGGSIRTGNRIPIPASSKESQFSYSDVGVNIDCTSAETVGPELAVGLAAELSSLSEPGSGTPSMPPVLRSTRWRSTALLPMSKPTVVFTAEDDKTNHTLELEVTATPVH